MNVWQWGAIIVGIIALPAVLYALHRFALHLERLGYIDYSQVTPRRVAGGLMPFQTAIEPPVKHVLEVQDQRRGIEIDRDGSAPNP